MARAAKKDDRAAPVRYWLNEIAAARKREKDYRKEGERIRSIYAGEKADQIPFNIVFSNTETMLPALYSALPRPVVQRRYKDDDVVGGASAQAGQRALEFLLDTNIDGYETFSEGMKWVVLDALLPGRGISTVKYDAEIGEVPGTDPAVDGDKQTEGEAVKPPEATPVKKSELICTDAKSWNRVFFGYSKKWSTMPWLAYEEHIDKTEATRLFGAEIAGKIEYTKGEQDEDEQREKAGDSEDLGERKTALVYQIWDKNGGRKIRYVSPHYKDGYCKVQDDPLQLTGFYNCPRPLMLIDKTDDLVPTALYSLYENQAKELNTLTARINKVVAAIKARGLYDAALGDDLERVLENTDAVLTPTEKAGTLAANGGLEKAIWMMPIDMLAAVLKELYVAREQCKQVIYEIMGISDILRGASNALETATAQQIKTQWGSLRLKPKQAEVQRYARDLLRMMLEVAATKFSEDTWARMTGLPFLTKMQAGQALQMAQAAAAQGNTEPLQQLQQQMTWEQVLGTLRDDLQRAYKVDIETNSTVEPEAVEDQKNISDLLTAIGEYLQGVAPLIQTGAMPFEVAQTMLMTIVRRFRFGSEIEDQIKQMKPPAPEDNGEAQKAQAEKQQMAEQMQTLQQESVQTKQQAQGQAQKDAGAIQTLQLQLKEAQTNNQLNARKSDLDVRELALKTEREVFALEQQRASDSLTQKSAGETQKLDFKRQLTGLEVKGAKAEADSKTKLSETVDSKLAEGLKGLQDIVGTMAETLAKHSETNQELVKVVSAPRIRRPKRDASGKITEVSEEIAA